VFDVYLTISSKSYQCAYAHGIAMFELVQAEVNRLLVEHHVKAEN